MGTLKPGATYIYERANGVTYAREFGSDPSTRKAIGWDYLQGMGAEYIKKVQDEEALWQEIRNSAKANPALQKALDRVIMIYRLSKDNPL